jgi:hypothetical protein
MTNSFKEKYNRGFFMGKSTRDEYSSKGFFSVLSSQSISDAVMLDLFTAN